MANSIIVFIPYFGKWPEWIDLFFDSVKRNPSIDFLIYTDCETEKYIFENVKFRNIDFHEYINEVNEKLKFKFNPPNAYKVCDLRPLFGYIHRKEFENYKFYGWCDIDLLFGNIREFYTDSILNSYDVFSTHNDRISGHFALFRNNQSNRQMFKRIYQWKEALLNPKFVGIDEHGITNAYAQTLIDKFNDKFKLNINNLFTRWLQRKKVKKLYLVEQFTTPFIPKPWLDGSTNSAQPSKWFYNKGVVTNDRDQNRKFIYVHFMNFKSSQWRHDGTKAPWENIRTIYQVPTEKLNVLIEISPIGIIPKEK